jgi:hypothetical protein
VTAQPKETSDLGVSDCAAMNCDEGELSGLEGWRGCTIYGATTMARPP